MVSRGYLSSRVPQRGTVEEWKPCPNHLACRSASTEFFLRASVPKDIRSVVGRTEVVRSLKTSDYREALRRLPLARAEVDAQFAEARRRVRTKVVISLSEHDLRQMVLRWFWREERLLAEKEFSSDRFQWLHREEAIKENLEVLG
ncbi:MAG: DUF6538 domain-containing protein, partial [Acidimicrobiia bacterium]